jgi:alpha-1,2-mannosyltransferase
MDAQLASEAPAKRSVLDWVKQNPIAPVIVIFAFAVRLWASDGLGGLSKALGYDGNVYFQAGLSLAAGELPYRDFVLVHPPGIAVFLAPFSLVAQLTDDATAFAAARLTFMVLGALGALLIYLVAKRVGTVAAVVAGLVYCVQPGLIYTQRIPYLELSMVLATLVGLLLLNRTAPTKLWLILGGALFGLAVATKLWAAIPLLVITIGFLVLKSWRPAAIYFGSAVAVGTAIMLPFFIAAPSQMLQMTVTDQLGRPPKPGRGLARLELIYGISPELDRSFSWPIVIGLFLLTVAVMLVVWFQRPVARIWVVLCAVQLLVIMYTPTFFQAYKAFYAVGLILLYAAFAQIVFDPLAKRWRAGSRLGPIVGIGALSAAVVVSSLFVMLFRVPDAGKLVPVSALTAAVSDGKCVTSDAPSLEILSNSLSRNLANGCLVLVDSRGTKFSTTRAGYYEILADYLDSGDYVILDRDDGGMDAASFQRVIEGRPVVMRVGKRFTVYGPRTDTATTG